MDSDFSPQRKDRIQSSEPVGPVGNDEFSLFVANVRDYAILMLDPRGHVASWNLGAERIKGYRAEEILGRHFSVFYRPDDVEAGVPEGHLAEAASAGHLHYEGWRVRKDGSRFWADVVITAVRDKDGQLRGFGKVTRDVTERRNAVRDLAIRSFHDTLTGLPNRLMLLERLGLYLAQLEASSGVVAVFLIGLDRFKVVNDTFGHEFGDQVLTELAKRLIAEYAKYGTVARVAGDEFVIACRDLAGREEATRMCASLADSLATPVGFGEERLDLSASIGVAVTSEPDTDAASLLRDAEMALHEAKHDPAVSQVRWKMFDPAMRAGMARRLGLEKSLQRAIGRDELRLVYQPVINLRTGDVESVEALLRWDHPSEGLIPPDEFIPIAEQTGLIRPIGAWVLEQACREVVRWEGDNRNGRPLGVSVNVSARQLHDRGLIEVLQRVLPTTGVDPSAVCLELTESQLMTAPGRSVEILTDLKKMGVALSIDDFGTGYSSLSYLKRLPVDSVKIDRSFVHGLGTDPHDSAIVAATIKMAQALELVVVAEGVEQRLQLRELRKLGCDYGQGWHFGRPQPPDAISAIRSGHKLDSGTVR